MGVEDGSQVLNIICQQRLQVGQLELRLRPRSRQGKSGSSCSWTARRRLDLKMHVNVACFVPVSTEFH